MNRLKIEREGTFFTSNQGFKVEIIEYISAKDVTIRYNDNTIVKNLQYSAITSGRIKNPNNPFVYGVGYLGVGKYTAKNGDNNITKAYGMWHGMIERSYSEKYHKKKPTYKDCTVAEEWHNFQVFAEWFDENYNPETMQGWHLDKDILVKENKIYSPETCCLVPNEINILFTKQSKNPNGCPLGVTFKNKRYVSRCCSKLGRINIGSFATLEEAFQAYKIAKEKHIKEVADEWRDQIEPRVYNTIYNYQVEITD